MPARPIPSAWTHLRRLGPAVAIGAFVIAALATPLAAQPYARFAESGVSLEATMRSLGGEYESTWNALFVTLLRSRLAEADSTHGLLTLARRVARSEPEILGSHIGLDALKLRDRWTYVELRARVRAAVSESLATVARNARQYGRADSLLRAALADYRKVGERRREAWVVGTLGAVAFQSGDYPRAEQLYLEALTVRRALGDPRPIGNTLNDLGTVNQMMKHYPQAYAYLMEAVAVRSQSGQEGLLGPTYGALGLVAAGLGRRDSAGIWFDRAVDLCASQGDSARTMETLINYAVALRQAGDAERAIALDERALAMARSLGSAPRQATIEANLAYVLRTLGRPAEALPHLERATALHEQSGDVRELASSLVEAGRLRLVLREPARARRLLERALWLGDSLEDTGCQAQALTALAIAARLGGDGSEGERLGEHALYAAIASGDSVLVHDAAVVLGDLAFDRDDLETALAWRARAAATEADLDDETRAQDALALAEIHTRLGRLDEAEGSGRQALDTAERLRLDAIEARALARLGDIAARRGDGARALAYLRRAAGMMDAPRARPAGDTESVALGTPRPIAHQALVALLTRLAARYPDSAFTEEAFGWAERGRAHWFADVMASAGAAPAPAPAPVTLAQARALLASDHEALLEYSVGDSISTLWVITRRAWRPVALPPRATLRAWVERLDRGLADPGSSETKATREAARALYRMLVEPAEPLLDKVEHLIVSPDDALAAVPFEALLAADPKRDGSLPRGAYLLERTTVTTTPSAAMLATRAAAGTSDASIVALGDPRFAASAPGAAGPSPAPQTAGEVAALAALGGRDVTRLTGESAGRQQLLALPQLHRTQILHLATRADANDAEPGRSGLWLASPSESSAPSRLALADIVGLDLAAALVTLSACEAPRGPEAGAGLAALTRAFMAAGAHSVVASLWSVNDPAAAALMQRFYRGMIKDGLDRAAALAAAQRASLKNQPTRAPYYWAPYMLVGEAGKLPSSSLSGDP